MLDFFVDQDLQGLTQLKKFMETFVRLEVFALKVQQLRKNVQRENTIHSKGLNQLMIVLIVLQALIAWVLILRRLQGFVRVATIAHLEVSQKQKKLLKLGIMLLQDPQYKYRVNLEHMQRM